MSDRELLIANGYIEVDRKNRGCVLQVWWFDSEENATVPQGWLANKVRERKKRLQQQRKPS
jgi:hypothetical protein